VRVPVSTKGQVKSIDTIMHNELRGDLTHRHAVANACIFAQRTASVDEKRSSPGLAAGRRAAVPEIGVEGSAIGSSRAFNCTSSG
jgi:hypothetical protein